MLVSTIRNHNQDAMGESWRRIVAEIDSVPDGITVAVSLHHLEPEERKEYLGHRPFRAASTIKILILIAVARALDSGALDLSSRIIPEPQTRVGGSGVLNWLSRDLSPTLADHAWLMIAISDNTASNVLIDAVGLPAIVSVGRDLGLTETVLHRHFMSTKRRPQDPSNCVSAVDLTAILTAIAADRAASPERCAWMRSLLANQQYREGIARHLPEGIDYAGKTGWQSEIVHDCGLLAGPGGTIALAILTEGYAEPYPAHELMGRIGRLAAGIIA